MPENPLLPNAELRALHALLKRAAKAEASASRKGAKARAGGGTAGRTPAASRGALLAGTLQQLRPGDLLVTEPGDLVPATLPQQAIAAPLLPVGAPSLLLAAGMAAALPAADPRPLVLALLRSGLDEPHWNRALAWAQEQRLPLILACADPSGANALRPTTKAKPDTMGWTALARVAARLKLPILTVDGEDAVAVYRVMQESVLRARSGDGPAVLWAVLPTPRELAVKRPVHATAQRRLERYLRTRDIKL